MPTLRTKWWTMCEPGETLLQHNTTGPTEDVVERDCGIVENVTIPPRVPNWSWLWCLEEHQTSLRVEKWISWQAQSATGCSFLVPEYEGLSANLSVYSVCVLFLFLHLLISWHWNICPCTAKVSEKVECLYRQTVVPTIKPICQEHGKEAWETAAHHSD